MSANKTKWVRLGEYIEQRREKYDNFSTLPICGVSREGFVPPKQEATNTSIYNVFYKNDFVFNPARMELNSICLNIDYDKAICSSLYEIFYIKNQDVLLPEYLNLFIKRDEFARFCSYDAIGSARNYFRVANMSDIQIPLPSISIQRELVNTYNGLKSLAEDNEALIAPLTQACEALVVDCKRNYDEVELGEYIESCDERNSEGKYTIDDVRGISTDKKFIPTKANMDGVSVSSYKVVAPFMFAYVADTSRRGDKIALALNSSEESYLVSSIYTVFKTCEHLLPQYLYMHLGRSEFDRYSRFNSWGSARETFDWSELCRVKIPLPPPDVQQSIVNLYHCIEEAKRIAAEAREQMRTLCPALIQKAIHS
jgi:restriction endonuclease S subunit